MRTALIALVICLAPLTALAERGDSECPVGTSGEDCTIYVFEDQEVEGTTQSGAINVIQSGRHGRTYSLLRVRGHFVPELVKSVEDL